MSPVKDQRHFFNPSHVKYIYEGNLDMLGLYLHCGYSLTAEMTVGTAAIELGNLNSVRIWCPGVAGANSSHTSIHFFLYRSNKT